MLFPTMAFALFFLVVYAVSWSLERENERRKAFLIAASWFFYGAWDWRFVGLLAGSALLNWGAAQLIVRADTPTIRRWVVGLGVAANLTILGFFKYYGFFVEQGGALLHLFGWERDLPLLQVLLPVGISFFTFQGVSYVIDVHREKVAAAKLLDVTLLMSFFPHLVAGPIVRASHLLPQFERTPTVTREMTAHAFLLIAWGLFKKTVIASELSSGIVDPVFFDPGAHGAWDLLAAVYAYAVQIYCDFSAYSDMAIGVAALLGYRFPRNFDQPYRSASLQDFWRRWHISLSSWLRDYLYIPLGGSRGPLWKGCRNVLITMLLGGVWHGAAWTFVAWGGLHGVVLAFERVWRAWRPAATGRWASVLGVVVTFHIVCLGWILFRAESFQLALDYVEGFARVTQPAALVTPFLAVLIAGGLAMHFLPARAAERLAGLVRPLPSPVFGAGLALVLLAVEAMRPEGVAPFIYFQF
ncbi:MBOAT family protein [Caulobacter sp. 17J80-11]|uniref:MBOAT family O-acyltransferase n=1 Tax=Caulobacter sp. 17J80-11 TaxID=2763502 RepID=UPI0016536548|nr:MBOAT family protein [Caulobacter sp. 17J80-11]MBC6981788.1 MBOAT family protein [Caulobacter sp. 17J80-11]